MAPTGQFLKQSPHFLHFSSFTLNSMSGVQTRAGHLWSLMCASYSSRKYLIVVRTGLGEVWPRPQREVSLICWDRASSRSMSPSLPSPFVMRCRMERSVLFPILHGTHLPQDSSSVNSRKNFAMAGMQVSSSITTIPPEPMIAPVLLMFSKSTGVSIKDEGMQPPEGPPICTALNLRFPLMPRPMSLSAPERAKTFVPFDFSVPRLANQSAPFRMIGGTLAKVSTLFRTDGRCQRPLTAGNGGFALGMPRLPSIEAMSAVASPHTKAPAPW